MSRSAVTRWLPALAFPVLAWAAVEVPAQQAVPQPAAEQPQDLQSRVGRLEAMLKNNSALDLLNELEALKAEVSRLRGQAEVQAHQIETLSKRQSDLYVDLDKRVEDLNKQLKAAAQPAAVEPAGAAAVPAASAAKDAEAASVASAATKEDPLAESKAYETALSDFRAANYDKAIAGFAAFLEAYPDSTLAPNAQYWTGYAYYARKDYKNALAHQTKLVSTYPQSAKVPDALLNIASNQIELNNLAAAKKHLEEIVVKYPGTNAASIATERLKLLK